MDSDTTGKALTYIAWGIFFVLILSALIFLASEDLSWIKANLALGWFIASP